MDDLTANPFHMELTKASLAVQLCASLTQQVQRTIQQSTSSTLQKSDLSPVTIGDFAVQALLTSTLHTAFPGDTFLAEESSTDLRANPTLLSCVWDLITSLRPAFTSAGLIVPGSKDAVLECIDLGGLNVVSDKGRVWVFDPIDGTATFLQGKQYAINCALIVDGVEQIGIIGCPNVAPGANEIHEERGIDLEGDGSIISAVRGVGTWLRSLSLLPASFFSASASGQEFSSVTQLNPATRVPRHGDSRTIGDLVFTDCATYTSTILPLHQQVAATLGTAWPGVDLFSSLMKYAALGMGHASVCMRVFKYESWRSNMWDHAGGILIFEEAGGKVTDLSGKRIDFSKGRKMADNFGLVCAPSSVHAEVLQIIHEKLQAHGPIPWSK